MTAVALGSKAIEFQKHRWLAHVDICYARNEATWKTKGVLKSLQSVHLDTMPQFDWPRIELIPK